MDLTATIDAYEARIADLELKCDRLANEMREPAMSEIDRRRFVDECAMRFYLRYSFIPNTRTRAEDAASSYDDAEALAAERDRRMQG